MVEITVQVPEILAELPTDEQEDLVRAGLREAIGARVRELEREHAQAMEQVEIFEARYGMSLERFEREGLGELDSLQGHETYNDWCFWQSVADEKQHLLAHYRRLDLR